MQALHEAGVPESAWKDQVEETDRLANFDDGVNAVLLASSLAEVDRLRQQLDEAKVSGRAYQELPEAAPQM